MLCYISIYRKKAENCYSMLETGASRSFPWWLMISQSEERRLPLVFQFPWGSWQLIFLHFTTGWSKVLLIKMQQNITCVLGLLFLRSEASRQSPPHRKFDLVLGIVYGSILMKRTNIYKRHQLSSQKKTKQKNIYFSTRFHAMECIYILWTHLNYGNQTFVTKMVKY